MFLHFSQCVLFGGQALAVDHRNQGGAIVVHCGRPLVLTGAFGLGSGKKSSVPPLKRVDRSKEQKMV